MLNRKPMSRRPFRSPDRRSRLVLERLETRCLLSGGLDPTFGVAGLATVDFAADDRAAAVVVQPDGRIILAGTRNGAPNFNFAAARLLPNGSPDPSFGTDGTGTVDFSFGGTDVVTAAALQSDGKIVLVGFTDATADGENDFAVLRLNTDGSKDLTFDGDGEVTVNVFTVSPSDDRANAVAIQPDGRIVLVGTISGASDNIGVARLNTDGSLDNAFAEDGKQQIFGSSEAANAVALQTDGKIVLAGVDNNDFLIIRLKSFGAADFNNGSFTKTIDFGGIDKATGIAVQADGKIVVSGFTGLITNEFAVARLLSDLSLDTTFNDVSVPTLKNGDGKLSFPIGVQPGGMAVVIQPGGKIVMAGVTRDGPKQAFALARVNPNGTLDSGFDGDGKMLVNFAETAFGLAVALQPDGKILAAGFTRVGLSSNSFAVARVLGANVQFLAVGGAPGLVEIFSQAGESLGKFLPYKSSKYVDAVAVALGDVNSDGIDDLITAATIGNPNVKVYDGATMESKKFFDDPESHVIADGFPYAVNFNVGANVAAGDVNGDGFADIITGAVPGNPHVKVFDGLRVLKSGVIPTDDSDELLAQGFVYGINFNVGANVAAGDVNGDGYEDIITGASAGNPHTKVFNARAVLATGVLPTDSTSALLAEFFPFALQFNVGVFVAAGDYDRDGFADIITGASVGNPEVRVFSGGNVARGTFDNTDLDASLLDFFFAFEVSENIGVSVGAADFTGDGRVDALTGTRNGAPRHRVFQSNAPDPATVLPAFDLDDSNFKGALYVAA